MTDKKTLSEQLAGMDLFGMSKCELLRELSGYDGCAEHADGNDTKCSECRKKQRLALIARIEEENNRYVIVWPDNFPRIHWTKRNPMQTLWDKVAKLEEETEEVRAALDGEDAEEILAETIDAIHCCLEIMRSFPPSITERLVAEHHAKNWDRGYYEPRPEEEPEKVVE